MNYPLLFFPGKVLFLDDDELLMESFSVHFSDCGSSCFTQPDQVTAYFEKYDNLLLDNVFSFNIDDVDVGIGIAADYLKLKNILDSNQALTTPVVLFVDYTMPTVDGISYCKKISDRAVKKVLLTGNEDLNIAINAFNEGVIDHYVSKSDDHLFDKIPAIVNKMRLQYFDEATRSLRAHCKSHCADKGYIDALAEYIKVIDPVKFCVIDDNGSYCFYDAQGNVHWFLIKSKADLDYYADIAEGFDAGKELVERLRQHQMLPFFLSKDTEDLPPDMWGQYMFQCKPVSDMVFLATHTDSSNVAK